MRQREQDRAVVSLLTGARSLIQGPEGWVQGVGARDKDGRPCDHDAPDAVAFCPVSAIYRTGKVPSQKDDPDSGERTDPPVAVKVACARVADALILMSDLDDTMHDEVLSAFDEAIRLSGGEKTA